MIQCRCFKCNSALETVRSRKIGLGPDCEANTQLAFNADIARGVQISGDAVYNLLSVFANNNANPLAQTLSLELIKVNANNPITWDTMAGIFELARTVREHGDEPSVTLIFNALREIAPAMTAMALGEASAAEALLDYDQETQKISLAATTVREGSEQLKKLPTVKRHGTRAWEFGLRDAAAVLAIVEIRWPLVKITADFKEALGIAANLPPVPPPPPNFESYLATDFVVITYKKKGADGKWLLTPAEGDALSGWLRDSMGACWYRKLYLQTNDPAWLIPVENRDEVVARLTALFAPKVTMVLPTTSAPRRARATRARV